MNLFFNPITAKIVTTPATAALVLIAILTLLALLIQKEIASSLDLPRARRLSQALNAVIFPLFIVFISAAIMRVAAVLR